MQARFFSAINNSRRRGRKNQTVSDCGGKTTLFCAVFPCAPRLKICIERAMLKSINNSFFNAAVLRKFILNRGYFVLHMQARIFYAY